MHYYERPLKVNGERPWRPYLGGRELDRIHGKDRPADGYAPEEWILSTTRALNEGREGMEEGICCLADTPERISLKSLIEERPVDMLGARHVAEYGSNMGVLVKTIDSAVRLGIQVHPDNAAALRLFGSRFGKTECWHIVGLRDDGEEPCMYLGFREGVTERDWRAAFAAQDVGRMQDMLIRIAPRVGDTYIVRGGVPHALGPGCLLVEIQEPTDIIIRLEKKRSFGLELSDHALHHGLGFDRMFECFHYDGTTEERIRKEMLLAPQTRERSPSFLAESLVGYEATPCFCMERLTLAGSAAFARRPVFSGMYVQDGEGELTCGEVRFAVARNSQIFVPAACGGYALRNTGSGPLRVLRFNGPKV